MKNWTILSVAAITYAFSASASADATLYGQVQQQILITESEDIEIRKNVARVGVKGSVKLASGLSPFYKFELNIKGSDPKDTTYRYIYAGLKGAFGTLSTGKIVHPYKATYTADIFKYKSGKYFQSDKIVDNSIGYRTPKFGAAYGYLTLIDQNPNTSEHRAYSIGVNAKKGNYKASIGYYEVNPFPSQRDQNSNQKVMSIGLAYKEKKNYLGINYESRDSFSNRLSLAATLPLYQSKLGLEYTKIVFHDATKPQSKLLRLGVYKNLGGNADSYLELVSETKNTDTATELILGYRVRF